MPIKRIKCPQCGNSAEKRAHNAKYCSAICRQKAYEKRKGIPHYQRAKKKTTPISQAVPQPMLSNKYFEQIQLAVQQFDPVTDKLKKRKAVLLKRFNKLATKGDHTQKFGKNAGTFLGLAYGFNQLDDDSTSTDIFINIICVPLLLRYAGKNLLTPSMDNSKISQQLDSIKLELNNIDEELNSLELVRLGEENAKQIALQASTPQIERTDSYTAIPAKEMKKINRNTYNLTGKWKFFLGEIEQNFTALIHGKPKQGKSHFSIQFAQYLHSKFGDVVYFAAEEGASKNMETKLSRWDAEFKIAYNILGIKGITDYLQKYRPKFIFIDSISRLQLSADNIKFLVDEYIDISWILVTQSTKHNSHRGSQELTHLVESVIHVVEGVAHQEGRTVNGPTELEIFPKLK